MEISRRHTALNAICPYFTMFPLEFPFRVLKNRASAGEWVLDPFCGRGTTNYASRILNLPSIGIDNSPVAAAISEAKLANATSDKIVEEAERILEDVKIPANTPEGEFWNWAYHENVLNQVCRLREGLLADCRSDIRKALRAIMLGALHGPRNKIRPSYFSNQSQRTYAPKPAYAVRYWKKHNLIPESVNVMGIIESRAKRYYDHERHKAVGSIYQADSREDQTFRRISERINWVVTSPPYYGMRTYLPDQWLRSWFLGGPSDVDYSNSGQLHHGSQDEFVSQLRLVWLQVGSVCSSGARMVIRFGSINDRPVDANQLIKRSLQKTGWRIHTVVSAGNAGNGKRQSLHFSHPSGSDAPAEFDVWASWEGH